MHATLPPQLETKLADFRRRVWIVKLTEGILAALFGLALSYIAVFVLDRFFETPGWVRGLILLAGAATLGLGFPLKWHRWVWRQRRLEDSARLLRIKFPRLGDQLLGIVELARLEEGSAGRSERLVQAAMEQTAEAVKDRDFTHAVPHARHRQWGWAAAGVIALVVAAFVLVNGAARNALVRWIMPWSNVERFTFANIEPLPPHLIVPYAEPFHFDVKLAPGTQWSPGSGTGKIADQPAVEAKLSGTCYPFSFPPQKKDVSLAISLGDVRKNLLIEPRTRPELSEITVHVKLPDYLGYKSEQTIAVREGTVSVLKGAEAAFEAKASRNLASAEVDGQPQQVNGATVTTRYAPVTADFDRLFNWKDHDGLSPREPLDLKVRAVADDPPRIAAKRDSLEEVVLDSETVNFDLTAADDFGIKEAGLDWVGSEMQADNKTPITGAKVVAAGGPEMREMQARATFCATREGVAPQALEIRAWAVDYLPGRPHIHSATFVLHILNKTDHALWLTEQFGKWLEASKESYEREQQLNAANKDLRNLKPDELDRPDNRRKVAQQAAAENANATRLDSLSDSGKRLVQQATKNDEFDPKRLEQWASMLKSLKDISSNRMPNVSDLLRQAASAPAGAPSQSNDPQQKGPQSPTSPSGEKTADSQNKSQQNGKTAPNVNNGQQPPQSPDAQKQDGGPSQPQAPSITDKESSMEKQPGGKQASSGKSAPGKLGLPTTELGPAPGKGNDSPPPPQTDAQKTLDNAVKQQDDLLAEFAKVSGQLSAILTSLEASTFVKRFKAASREQIKLATTIDDKTLDAFGIADQAKPEAVPIAKQAKTESETVRVIQSDLEAYYQRKQDDRFKGTIEEMKKSDIVKAMAGDGEKVAVNLSGQAITGSQYWADMLDRWAEEMVAASSSGQSGKDSKSEDSLPPEIVVKVMQALRDEMNLRDETREAENAKPALEPEKYSNNAKALGAFQGQIRSHTAGAYDDILALPDGDQKFGKELKLLKDVTGVMNEAQGILETPETGPTAIAAETDAIEMLLKSKRSGGKGGGGGGGSDPGGGGTASGASSAALSELGPGDDAQSSVSARPVGQQTGNAGKEFPDEYKTGLDSYFNLLEKQPNGAGK